MRQDDLARHLSGKLLSILVPTQVVVAPQLETADVERGHDVLEGSFEVKRVDVARTVGHHLSPQRFSAETDEEVLAGTLRVGDECAVEA